MPGRLFRHLTRFWPIFTRCPGETAFLIFFHEIFTLCRLYRIAPPLDFLASGGCRTEGGCGRFLAQRRRAARFNAARSAARSQRARSATPSPSFPRSRLASAHAPKGETERAAAELAEARSLERGDLFSSIAHLKAYPGAWRGAPKTRASFEAAYFAGLRKAPGCRRSEALPPRHLRPPPSDGSPPRTITRCCRPDTADRRR